MPIFYQCQRCTACCRWPGQVKLTDAEIHRLAAVLQITEFDFIQQFTRLRAHRRGLALLEKPNGECVFLDGSVCKVQSAKPQQCRDFPNLWRIADLEQSCRALPIQVPPGEWQWLVAEATGRPPAEVAQWLVGAAYPSAPTAERSAARSSPGVDAEIP